MNDSLVFLAVRAVTVQVRQRGCVCMALPFSAQLSLPKGDGHV